MIVSVVLSRKFRFQKILFHCQLFSFFYIIDVWKLGHPTQAFLLDHSSRMWVVETQKKEKKKTNFNKGRTSTPPKKIYPMSLK